MKYKVFNGKCAENAIIEASECCETPFDCLDGCQLVNDRGQIAEFAEAEPLADAPQQLRIGARRRSTAKSCCRTYFIRSGTANLEWHKGGRTCLILRQKKRG